VLTASRALGVAIGLAASLVVFSLLFVGESTRFDEAALDENESKFAVVDGVRVHCSDLSDAAECIAGAARCKACRRYLWLGNSQLHAINQRKPADRSAPELLHMLLRASGSYLVTFSEPNANLQEHLVLFAYLLPRLKPDVLLLPVVFDDFRETGVRAGIAPALRDDQARAELSDSRIGATLLAEGEHAAADEGDLAGVAATVQEKSERALTGWLEERWALWAARPQARGEIALFLYELRNSVFGIKPTTARRVIPGRFAKNWSALEAIIDLAGAHRVNVLLYIVPLRNDVKIPYVQREYSDFKEKLRREFADREGVRVLDLERIVDNRLWGTKAATTVGGEPEYDFMHFQARGHEALASALHQAISQERDGDR